MPERAKQRKEITQRIIDALEVFKRIEEGDKLIFDDNKEIFDIDKRSGFKRGMSNLFKITKKNSVTNTEMFEKPILSIFQIAKFLDINKKKELLDDAYSGLERLRETYKDNERKLNTLNNLLNKLHELKNKDIKTYPYSLDFLTNIHCKNAAEVLQNFNTHLAVEDNPPAIRQVLTQTDEYCLLEIFKFVSDPKSKISYSLQSFFNKESLHAENKYKQDYIGIIKFIIYDTLERINNLKCRNVLYDHWLTNLKTSAKQGGFQTYFQNTFVKVNGESTKISINADIAIHPDHDFLWFFFPNSNIQPNSRLYLCPNNMGNIHLFVTAVGKITGFSYKFKIDYRKDLKFDRRDAIVLYYEGNQQVGERLAGEIKKKLNPGFFRKDAGPFNGKSVSSDNDIFFLEEPRELSTGIDFTEERLGLFEDQRIQKKHSATEFRSELITMALLRWKIGFEYQISICNSKQIEVPELINKNVFDSEFEVFKNYVACALKGYHDYLINKKE